MKNWWKEFFKRLTMPCNPFWSKFRNYCVFIGTFCLVGANIEIIPEMYRNWMSHGLFFAYFGAAVAQLTVQDPNKVKFENDFNGKN